MIELPSGVNINNLIDDLRIFSWEASDILINYSQILKDSNNRSNIFLNGNNEDPVTLADLKVNDIIIQRISEKYKNIVWEILSEENAKKGSNICNTKALYSIFTSESGTAIDVLSEKYNCTVPTIIRNLKKSIGDSKYKEFLDISKSLEGKSKKNEEL